MITCSSCNHQNEFGSSFCENCGHDLRGVVPAPPAPKLEKTSGATECSSCGHPNIPGTAFCENCGTRIEQAVPPVPDQVLAASPEEHLEASTEAPLETPAAVYLKCSNCGHENVPGSIFCENCGNQLDQEVPELAVEEIQDVPAESHPEVSSPDKVICDQCGFLNPADSFYCENCGHQLSQAPAGSDILPIKEEQSPVPSRVDGIPGSLVLPNTGISIPIPAGLTEAFIGREDPISGIFPEIDLDPHGGHDGGVGRRHARLFLQGSQVMIEDLDSVNGTWMKRKKLTPRQPCPVNDGEEIRFGKIAVIYHAS